MRHEIRRPLPGRIRPPRPSTCRPALVRLEDRSVPAVFLVTNASDHDPGSLRWAIQQADAAPGADAIQFDVPANPRGLITIVLSSPLPPLSDPVTVDATTEPLYAGSPLVVLDGSQVEGPGAAQACGLTLAADGCGVFGLVVEDFAGDGVSIQSSGNSISADFVDDNGRDGVAIFDAATGNIVANTGPYGGNDISRNHRDGVNIYGPGTANNVVAADTILSNRMDGVTVSAGASFNTVGGPPVQSGNLPRSNVISGNGAFGVQIDGPETTGNVLDGNWIGLAVDGHTPDPNSATKLTYADVGVLDSPGNQIGSTDPRMQNVISGCPNDGIQVIGLFATGNTIEGNWVGTDVTGTRAVPNHIGITIRDGASDNVVGGSTAAARNVVAGNARAGIYIGDSPKIPFETTGNRVLGNWVGLGADGQKLGTQFAGVWLAAPDNQVGGPGAGDGNVISGNATAGVYVAGSFARGNRVQGNLIGTDPTGAAAVGNGFGATKTFPGAGVLLVSPGAVDNLIGGTDAGDGNVISGNVNDGVLVSQLAAPAPSGNLIEGNSIGTNRDGTGPVPNTRNGIELTAGAADNRIGGTEAAARNLIAGNTGLGISIHDRQTTRNRVEGNWVGLDVNGNALANAAGGVAVSFVAPGTVIGGPAAGAGNVISGNGGDGLALVAATQAVVQGNRVGTDPTGLLPRGNQGRGIVVTAARGNFIGGTVPGAGNLISANSGDGLLFSNKAVINYVFGNDVGTDETGRPAAGMGNGSDGIELTTGAALNLIGAPGVGAQNVIAGNSGTGIVMPTGGRNAVRENAIFANQGGGIRLVPTGRVAATPVLDSVALDANGHPVVRGTLQGAPNMTYAIEFFASGAADATGNGSGEVFLNSRPLQVVTDAHGFASFTALIPALDGPFTYFLSATATDALLNTSGFSNYVTLSGPGGP